MTPWLDGFILGALGAGMLSVVVNFILHLSHQRSIYRAESSALKVASEEFQPLIVGWQDSSARWQAAYEHEHSIVRALSDRLVIMEFEARARDLNIKLDWEGVRMQ